MLPLNDGRVEILSSFHGCLGTPVEVELEHSKVVVSWLLLFHVLLFRIPAKGGGKLRGVENIP